MSESAHLQREASAARVGLSSALDDLRESVSTTALTNGAMTFAKEGSTAVARAAIDRAMASPLAAMLIGAGVFMLMTGGNKDSQVGAVVHKGNEAVKSTASTLAGVEFRHRRRGIERAVGGFARLGRGVRHRRRHGRPGEDSGRRRVGHGDGRL